MFHWVFIIGILKKIKRYFCRKTKGYFVFAAQSLRFLRTAEFQHNDVFTKLCEQLNTRSKLRLV